MHWQLTFMIAGKGLDNGCLNISDLVVQVTKRPQVCLDRSYARNFTNERNL